MPTIHVPLPNSIGLPEWHRKLGKKPARPGAIKFQLAHYLNLALPKPPAHFRHADPPRWGDYGNSDYGDCVLAGAANETSLWEHEGGGSTPNFTTKTVLADYSAITGFDPKRKEETDQGTEMSAAARYRRTTGMVDDLGNRHKIDGYGALRLRNFDYLKAAMWTLGGVGLGFKFPSYAMTQFDAGKPWSLQRESLWGWVKGIASGDEVGGHYVPAIGIASNGNIICVSWGREQEMTPEFYLEMADEVTGFIDLDRLSRISRLSPEGFNEARLRHDLAQVAGGRVYALTDTPTDWA